MTQYHACVHVHVCVCVRLCVCVCVCMCVPTDTALVQETLSEIRHPCMVQALESFIVVESAFTLPFPQASLLTQFHFSVLFLTHTSHTHAHTHTHTHTHTSHTHSDQPEGNHHYHQLRHHHMGPTSSQLQSVLTWRSNRQHTSV